MTQRNSETLLELCATEASTEESSETPFIHVSGSSTKEEETATVSSKRLKDGVREGGDVVGSDDVNRGGSDVRPPHDVDGGWAWVVLVTSCMSLAIQEVMFSVAGMFQVEFQMAFESSRGFLALIGSIFVTTTGMLGPLAGVLSHLLTSRLTMILGGALTTSGLVAASFVTSTPALLLTYALLGGLGNALIYTPAATVFSGYFCRLRQIANGFLMASSGLGMLVGPFLARWFIDRHGWRFSMAVSGFLMAQICVLSALIFPRSGSRRLHLCRKTACVPRCLLRDKKQHENTEGDPGTLKGGLALSEKDGETNAFLGEKSGEEGVWEVREKLKKPDSSEGDSLRRRVWMVVARKEVWVLCVNQMLLMSGYNIQLLHQPSYIHSLGSVDSRHFPSLFLAFGMSMMTIRVVGGFVFTRFDRYLVPAIFLSEMTMALTLGLLPFYGVTLPALFVFNILTGLSFGLAFGLATPVMISFIGVDLLPLAYGLMIMCCGSASVLCASLAGALYDLLGTYTASFYLAGGVTATGALSLLLLLFIHPKKTIDRP